MRHAVHLQAEHYHRLASLLEEQKPKVQSMAGSDTQAVDGTPAEQLAVLTARNSQADINLRIAAIVAAVLLPSIPLEERALQLQAASTGSDVQNFLASIFDQGVAYLASSNATSSANLFDPRLFAFVAADLSGTLGSLSPALSEAAAKLCKVAGIDSLPSGSQLSPGSSSDSASQAAELMAYTPPAKLTLPEVPVGEGSSGSKTSAFVPAYSGSLERQLVESSSSFAQYRRSKDKVARDKHGKIIGKLASRRLKADQRYASWVAAYAQSLIGSAGLVRQAITEGATAAEDKKKAAAVQQQQEKKEKKGGKPLSKKEQIIAQNQARKSDKASAQVERRLGYLLEELDIGPATSKFDSADQEMLDERRRLIAALAPYLASAASQEAARDLRLLKVRLAVEGWVCACTIEKKADAYDLAVVAFTEVGAILSVTPASGFNDHERALLTSCGQALRVLGLQGVYGPSHAGLENVWDEVEEKKGKPAKKGEFPFDINWPRASKKYIVGDALDFQLTHCGDVMGRQLDSKEDKRVATFKPDGWQRRVLDGVDARDSLLVVAPTSAGKTFIAFYCIEKALRESSDSVVVYVAPTKALVNQIAAELEARYTKNYGASERTIWAISSGDFDVHNPLKCQVLVAAPSVLHKMCLQSDVAGTWLPRVKAVIVDEVHSLNDIELGRTQQQLLAMMPSPVIALSATVGNVDEFGRWLGEVRKAHGQNLTVVQHSTRYSDLKKHVYLPAKTQNTFEGITKPLETGRLFKPLHPFSALRPLGASLPADLEMTPAEQLQLVRQMQKYAAPEQGYSIADDLDPVKFFGDVVGPLTRAHTLKYQAALREVTLSWMSQPNSRSAGSPLIKVIDALEAGLTDDLDAADNNRAGGITHIEFQKQHLLPLLSGLHQQTLLPALCFNFSRDEVDILGYHLFKQLQDKEEHYKATNRSWLAKVKEWEQWQEDEPARKKAEEKRLKAIKGREEAEALKKDAQKSDAGWQASFDPEAPLADFTFANEKCGMALEDVIPEVGMLKVDQWLKDALIRGVAIHHTGMNLNYRQIVERYFRRGWLRVVICTGSLALGINMPAKTSVFVGDHHELNALQYRQAAGRAGRRGMDLAGNVLFYGIPMRKIHRLLTSRLPALDCDFPSSATFALRLHGLMVEGPSKQVGEKMTQSIVSLPTPPSRTGELGLPHQLRASVEYLRRFGLLSKDGQTQALTGIAQHLVVQSTTSEPANLAFIELLRSGSLYNIAASAERDRIGAVETFVSVLSHLFASRPVNPTSRFEKEQYVLPALPKEVQSTLEKLNDDAKAVNLDYVSAVMQSKQTGLADESLPFSSSKSSGSDAKEGSALASHAIPHRLRTSYVSASGVGDKFNGTLAQDVAVTLRNGLCMTPSVVPSFDHLLDQARRPRNSYILDFFRQGNLESLVKTNGLPGAATAWLLLREFWDTLLALRTSLELILQAGAKAQSNADRKGGTAAGLRSADSTRPSTPSSELESWEVALDRDVYQGYTEDGTGEPDDDDDAATTTASAYTKTDSGIAGSQMSASTNATTAAGRQGPTVHRAGEVRTRSGKVVEPISEPITIPAHLRHEKLWVVYRLLWDVMSQYHARFFATFA